MWQSLWKTSTNAARKSSIDALLSIDVLLSIELEEFNAYLWKNKNQISPMNTRQALRLWVVRAYQIPERSDASKFRSKEVVFHDEEGSFLHAHIPKEYVEKYLSSFAEGSVYAIKKFCVITNFYSYKTSPQKYMIKFNYQTMVKDLKHVKFPMKMYRLKTFREIKSNEGHDEKILFDVIGRVIEIHCPQEKLINSKNSRLIDFTIEDTDGIQLMCTLWDEHVSKIEAFYNSTSQEPLLVLIQFCRARVCLKSGDVKICSSYDVTQLLFNQESHPFEEFRKSISHEQTPMRSIISQSSFKECSSYSVSLSADMEVRTINDIHRDKQFGDFWVAARIVFIDDPEWYYASCRTKGCNKKLKLKGKWLWCSTCDRNLGDGTLRECLDLLGISADDLKDTHTKGRKGLPKELETLIGLNLLFRITVRKEQFQNYLNAFPVMRIITNEKIVAKHAPELIGVRDRDLSSKLELELTNEDLWDLEEANQANEAESPLQVVAQRLNAENSIENGTNIFFRQWCHNDVKRMQMYDKICQEMADMTEQNEEDGRDITKNGK
ncbi:PREDICTED: uncharacterized protein LOC109150380 [Ipomoea nil]|uniref:uncharacterized protein LOC109150380 n=1 Tax=Ipomoea nil TaxID=35883 RepID=UPI0009012579|nr:PREDICTED: uncharacterized protein LOC109150380 [Ipomoea nil]